MCVRAGLRAVCSRLAGRVSGAAGRLRTGVCTLWCPLAQQFRTPLCILVHLAQAGSPCWWHVTDVHVCVCVCVCALYFDEVDPCAALGWTSHSAQVC